MNYDGVNCIDCKHRPINLDALKDNPKQTSVLNFPDKICPLQCEDYYYNKWISNNFFCAFAEIDKNQVCKNCKYFHTEFYENPDIRFSTRNFCYAVKDKEEVHPFGKACEVFKKRKDNE